MCRLKYCLKIKIIISALIITALVCVLCALCGCGSGKQELAAPQNLKVEAEVLSWDAVENAERYVVDISGKEYYADTNELDIIDKTLGEEIKGTGSDTFTYEIKVMALGNFESYYDSDWSPVYSHEQKFIINFNCKKTNTYENGYKEEVYQLYVADENAKGKIVVPEYAPGTDIRVRFFKCPVGCTSAYLPDTVTLASFEFCKNLTAVRLSDNIKEFNHIMRSTFLHCESLKKIRLPKAMENFTAGAFLYCNSLMEITAGEDNENFVSDGDQVIRKSDNALVCALTNGVIPQGVLKIETAMLDRSYKKLYIPQSVKEMSSRAFNRAQFDEIEVDEANEYFNYEDGFIFDKKQDGLLLVAFNNYKIPVGVTEIAPYAFSNLSALYPERILIPDTVRKINYCAFYMCYESNVTIPESVEIIGKRGVEGKYIYLSENQVKDNWATEPVVNDPGKFADVWYDKEVARDVRNYCKLKYDGGYPYVYALKATIFGLPSLKAAPVRDGYTLLGFTSEEGGTVPEILLDENNRYVHTESDYLYAVWQKN